MTSQRIHLGFEVSTGDAVSLPVHHVIVTGVTRLAGKTTTIEAMLSRLPANYSALVFRTKRGEVDFCGAHRVEPYFRPMLNSVGEVDWEYVQSLLEAAMGERLKFERSWIIRSSRGAHSLREVYENIKRELERSQKRGRGLDESVYTNLSAYFEKILPQLEEYPFAQELTLTEDRGTYVMELGHLTKEVQALVISSCLQEVQAHRSETVVVIPEAWEFLPQARGNPVKWAAQRVIRQGGASSNFLWLDSQDVTTVTKDVLKSVGVWLMGRQQEKNEVQRVLDQLPIRQKPRAEEVMTLGLGHFFVATEDWCKKVYIQMASCTPETARNIAMGDSKTIGDYFNTLAPQAGGELPLLDARGPADTEGVGRANLSTVGATPKTKAQTLRLETVPLAEMEKWKQLALSSQQQAIKALDKLRAVEVELDTAKSLLRHMETNFDKVTKTLDAELAPWRKFREGLEAILPAHGHSDSPGLTDGLNSADLEALARLVADRLGLARTPVAPLESLKHHYQQRTVEHLLETISLLDAQQRSILEWLVAVGGSFSFVKISQALGLPSSGGSYSKNNDKANEMVAAGWLSRDSSGLKAILEVKVREALAPYNPDDTQVEQVFAHLVNRLAEKKERVA